MRPLQTIAIVPLLIAAACGSSDDASTVGSPDGDADRTIEIAMRDIEFSPDSVTVKAGETVRFVFTNEGDAEHDAFLGDEEAQAEHGQEMAHGGGHGSDSDTAISVKPGKTGEITHTFDADEELLIGCHQPGHYEAGMRVLIEVT